MEKHPTIRALRLPAYPRVAAQLGLPDMSGRYGLVIAILIDNLGSGAFLPFAVLYAVVVARIPIATTGLILSLCATFALPGVPVAGILVDRYGAKRVVTIANLVQALGFAGYPLITTPLALFACALAVAVGSQAYFASQGSLVAQIAPPDHRARWFALLGACRSAGLSGGALLSGLALVLVRGADGYRLLAGVNALSFVVAAFLIARMAAPTVNSVNDAQLVDPTNLRKDATPFQHILSVGRSLSGYRPVLRDGPFLGFTATNVAFSLIVLGFSVVLPLYLVRSLRLPEWTPGVAFALNTTCVVIAQTVVARWTEAYRRTRALASAAGLFAIAMLLLAALAALSRDAGAWLIAGLLAALLIYTVAVLIMAPLKNALIADAAPDALRGRYIAFYHLSWSFASAVGPASLTALFALGADWVWLALAGVALVALLALYRLDSALPLHAILPLCHDAPPLTLAPFEGSKSDSS